MRDTVKASPTKKELRQAIKYAMKKFHDALKKLAKR
jgi:hypothetical protein